MTFAPTGNPPTSPIKMGVKPFLFILKNSFVGFLKIFDKKVKDFEEAIYEESTKNGKSDGIIVESKSVIPFFIPSLDVFGLRIIAIINENVKSILGK